MFADMIAGRNVIVYSDNTGKGLVRLAGVFVFLLRLVDEVLKRRPARARPKTSTSTHLCMACGSALQS